MIEHDVRDVELLNPSFEDRTTPKPNYNTVGNQIHIDVERDAIVRLTRACASYHDLY